MKKLLYVVISLMMLLVTEIYSQTYTLTLNAKKKTQDSLTINSDLNSSCGSNFNNPCCKVLYGAYSFSLGDHKAKTYTLYLSRRIDVKNILVSYHVNADGVYMKFYNGTKLIKSRHMNKKGWYYNIGADNINKIEFVSNGTSAGGAIDFQKIQYDLSTITIPLLSTENASQILDSSATLNGNVFSDGGDSLDIRGFEYSTINNFAVGTGTRVTSGIETGLYQIEITNLVPKTKYYFRAFAENLRGIKWGLQKAFVTLGLPVLTTDNMISITDSSARSGGVISDNGGTAILECGLCWNTVGSPTISDFTTSVSILSDFDSDITNLEENTLYYVRSYATNKIGTNYGDERTLYTLAKIPNAPIINNPTATTATLIIDSIGNNTKTRYAIQESTTGKYVQFDGTLGNNKVWQQNYKWGAINLNGLYRATIYSFKVQAINLKNVPSLYGLEQSLTTNKTAPVLAPNPNLQEYINSSALAGGNILDDGGAEITSSGICWNSSGDPTTSDNNIVYNATLGEYMCNISGLVPGANYHVRAYATNELGTTYSNDLSFATIEISASIEKVLKLSDTLYQVTTTISNLSETAILDKGYVWGTYENPTLETNYSTISGGTGEDQFSNNLNVPIGPGYFVKAYVTTEAGTYYSDQIHFGVVPTLPEWGLILLAGGFVITGGWFMFRKFM